MVKKKEYSYPVRSSTVVTALRVVGLVGLGMLLSLLSYVPLVLVEEWLPEGFPVVLLAIVVQILIQLLVSMGIVIALVSWANTAYIIRQKEIVVQHGGFSIKQKIYPLSGHEEVKIYQSFLGKLFNYGTLAVYQPVLRKYVNLENIQEPDLYAEVIRQAVPKESLDKDNLVMTTARIKDK